MNKIPNNHIELAGAVTLGPKGQVVIPMGVRKKMGIVPGDRLIALYIPDNDSIGFVHEAKMQVIIDKMGERLKHETDDLASGTI